MLPLRAVSTIAAVSLFTLQIPAIHAADLDLPAFIKQLQEQVKSSSDGNYRQNLVSQFQQLESAMKRGDFERAQQMLQNLSGYGGNLPPDLQTAWSDLADQLATQMDQQQRDAAIRWKTDVDALAKQTREACMQAKSSDDLDAVLIACSALQMKRVSQNNILAQRANQKLQNIAQALQTWSDFLDSRDSGNARQANNNLRQILNNGGGSASILPRADLEKFYLPEPPDADNASEIFATSLQDVKTVAELEKAAAELHKTFDNPQFQNNRGVVRQELARLHNVNEISAAIAKKQYDAAAALLQQTNNGSWDVVTTTIRPFLDDLQTQLLVAQFGDLTPLRPERGESPGVYLKRVADALRSEGKYAELASIMVAANGMVSRSGRPITLPWNTSDLQALPAYVSGTQYEAAGDALMAVNQYRQVIALGQAAKYAPVAAAQKSLERLKASNPEAFKDLDGAMMAQIQQLRNEVRSLQMMSRGPGGYWR